MTGRVFISHSSLDKDFVDELANNLTSYNVSVWYDKWEIKVGDSLVKKINEGISDCKFMIVVLSNNSISSSWVTQELNTALILALEQQSISILPLLLDKVRTKIPPLLKDKKYADFTENYDNGFTDLVNCLTNSQEGKIRFITKQHYSNWSTVLREIPDYTKSSLRHFTRKLVIDNERVTDTAFIVMKFHFKGYYKAEIETESIYNGFNSLILYGLVSNALIKWDLASRPKGIYFAGRLTKIGFLIAKELGYSEVNNLDFDRLPEK